METETAIELAVGDHCWLLLGVCLYEVDIAEVRILLEDEPERFKMFRVKARENWPTYFKDKSQHRSDLFKLPEEREKLAARIDSDRDALADALRNLEREYGEPEQE